jgi:8-oxo-dGTP diphosphatase
VPIEASLCHIIRDRRLLLKLANGGISKGKWNGPGGKFERGVDPDYHGKIEFYMNGRGSLDYLVHVFMVKRFSGRARSSEEGRVRWFGLDEIPYTKMWDDDRYWLPLLLGGTKFNARFFYDKQNSRVVSYEISSGPSV